MTIMNSWVWNFFIRIAWGDGVGIHGCVLFVRWGIWDGEFEIDG
jgi:hypothetical protein